MPLLKHFSLPQINYKFTSQMVIIITVTILYQSLFVEPNPSAHSQPPSHRPHPPPQWKENPFGCQTDLASTLALPLTSNMHVKSLQSCSTLCEFKDYRLLLAHGILQATISGELVWTQDRTHISSPPALAVELLPLVPPGKAPLTSYDL